MSTLQRITPFLWFDDQAEAAADHYVSIFPDSRILHASRYTEAGQDIHGRPPGSVMAVDFELCGQRFTALNGGPMFHFTEAVSFQVHCADQAEIDHYWTRLGAGGDPAARRCGWLKDRYGLSWQVIPNRLPELLARTPAAMTALMTMECIDIATLERAR